VCVCVCVARRLPLSATHTHTHTPHTQNNRHTCGNVLHWTDRQTHIHIHPPIPSYVELKCLYLSGCESADGGQGQSVPLPLPTTHTHTLIFLPSSPTHPPTQHSHSPTNTHNPTAKMVNLRIQKRLAASVLKTGKRKVWLDPNETTEISMANSRANIRKVGTSYVDTHTHTQGHKRWSVYM
jgi:hypothetical protein